MTSPERQVVLRSNASLPRSDCSGAPGRGVALPADHGAWLARAGPAVLRDRSKLPDVAASPPSEAEAAAAGREAPLLTADTIFDARSFGSLCEMPEGSGLVGGRSSGEGSPELGAGSTAAASSVDNSPRNRETVTPVSESRSSLIVTSSLRRSILRPTLTATVPLDTGSGSRRRGNGGHQGLRR